MAIINGTAGSDTLVDNPAEADTINALGGNDTITVTGGADTLFAGTGNDILNFSVSALASVIADMGEGADIVNIGTAAPGQVRLTFTSAEVGNGNANDGNALTNQDGGLAVRLQSENGSNGFTGPVSRFDDENIVFTSAPGTTFDVRDLVSGVSRGDQFRTAALGSNVGDTIAFASDVFPVYVNAGMGNDTVTGGTRDDFLVGGGGDDVLDGADGNDSFIGGLGNDTIIGGAGNDIAIFNVTTDGADSVNLGEGADFVNVSRATPGQVRLTFTSAEVGNGSANDGNALTNQDGGLAVRLQSENGSNGFIGPVSRFDDENIIFTSAPGTTFDVRDLVSGVSRGDQFRTAALGSTVGDLITFANDLFPVYANGGLGNDTITGGTQADVLVGGTGNDLLTGAMGNDTYIVDSFGDQTIELAGGGTDTISASISRTLVANVENLVLTGAANLNGNGNQLGNVITGNSGNNALRGYDGDDTIIGGAGADTLFGDAGRDVLDGGAGRDLIYVGADAERDFVVLNAPSDSTGALRDFVSGMDLNNEDRFDFAIVPTSIAATVTTGSLNEATFNTDLAAAIGAGQLGAGQAVLFDPSAGDANAAGQAYLIVDANGVAGYQAGQDYVVQLFNATGTLSLDDFT